MKYIWPHDPNIVKFCVIVGWRIMIRPCHYFAHATEDELLWYVWKYQVYWFLVIQNHHMQRQGFFVSGCLWESHTSSKYSALLIFSGPYNSRVSFLSLKYGRIFIYEVVALRAISCYVVPQYIESLWYIRYTWPFENPLRILMYMYVNLFLICPIRKHSVFHIHDDSFVNISRSCL